MLSRSKSINKKYMAAEEDLDKLLSLAEKPQENIATIRNSAARLHSKTSTGDKSTRIKVIETISRKNSGYIALLLSLLENVKDHTAVCSIIGILHECCTPYSRGGGTGKSSKNTRRGARSIAVEQLVQLGGTHSVLKFTVQLIKESSQQHSSSSTRTDGYTHDILWLLAHLAQRDARFPLKCKISGAVKPLHSLLRVHGANSKLLYPILMIMKVLARNAITAGILVKDGAAQSMETTLASLGLSPNPRLRLCLDVVNLLGKNRVFCVRLARTPTIHLLLRMLERCDHQDNSKTQLRVCSICLAALHRLCSCKPGRMVLRSHNGLQLLQAFCIACPEERNRDAIVARACDIISLCLENRISLLPAEGNASPARFPLPIPVNNSYLQGEQSSSTSSRETPSLSDDDDPTIDEDDDVDDTFEQDDNNKSTLPFMYNLRDINELQSYSKFFTEYDLKPIKTSQTDISDDEGDSIKSFSELSIEPQYLPTDCIKDIKLISKIRIGADPQKVYCYIASKVNSVVPFAKVAYPDMVGAESINLLEPLNIKERRVCRFKLLQCIDRGLHPEQGLRRVVYDLDAIIETQKGAYLSERNLGNCDRNKIGQDCDIPYLLFESRFEGGNLRRAVQVGPREYDLMLMPDVNSTKHHQWFYFEVSNIKSTLPYTFNIVNCEKTNSQFNYGMKPLLFSVQSSIQDQLGWMRVGSDICYYKNTYQTSNGRQFYTATFSITFPHVKDICYIAYHFPYPYSRLMTQLWNWSQTTDINEVYFKASTLCYSLNDNEVPVLTITAPNKRSSPIQDRQVVVLTGRVHPGESNSSWVMEGSIQFLLGNSERAARLRDLFIFKIIPMLNTEGVINGCHRCGLTDEDLNRRWSKPDSRLHPVIYNSKGLIEYCVRVLGRVPYLYCDLHGHSRRKNIFLYGCSRAGSWSSADHTVPEDPAEYLLLPEVLHQTAPAFSLQLCNFRVERNRESTARVTLWRQLGITRSYTLESSYCGCDQGGYEGYHLGTAHLHEVGRNLCESLGVAHEDGWKLRMLIAAACNQPSLTENNTTKRLAGLCGLGELRRDDSILTELSDSSDYDEEYHELHT